MDPSKNLEIYRSKQKSLEEFLGLIRPRDFLSASIAAGQPRTLLNQLGELKDIEDLKIFTGLLAFPYPVLNHPKVRLESGYYGPLERMLNETGANISYVPLPFRAFEKYVEEHRPRVVMTTLSSMDDEGYLYFGVDAEAVYVPFVNAARDPNRLAIAEVNPNMPGVKGIPELGGNKIHVSELDALVEAETTPLEVPLAEPTEVESKIAEQVAALIQSGDTLQFGIGAIPNEVARILAKTEKGDFGILSELISDGFLTLMESGKISNRHKQTNPLKSIFSFALGTQQLYDFLDERNGKNQGRVLAAPVSYVNDPSQIARNPNMVAVNAGFLVDMAGQVCSEAIGMKQYSGVGGQLDFVQGAFLSRGGRNILCIKSAVRHEGKQLSNIVCHAPPGSIVSTPRHFVQWIVTEYGAVNLFGVPDEERPLKLISIAHPDFREELRAQAKDRDKAVYHSRLHHK